MTINGVYILIVVGAWAAYKLGMRFGVDSAPDGENRCICADMLPVGESPRPCPQHGWMGEGTDRENGSER